MNTPEFDEPLAWLQRISFSTGIWEELAKQHEVHSIEQINYAGRVQQRGVNYHFLNFKKRKLYFPRRLHAYIKKLQPDLVWVHGFIFPLQILQLRRALGKNIPIIVQNHAEKPFNGWRRVLQQQAARAVDVFLLTSTEMGKDWTNKKIFPTEKIFEVMEASSHFKPLPKAEALAKTKAAGSPVFLWVGRLDANKDPVTVLKAFLEFCRQHPEAKLYLIYQNDALLKTTQAIAGSAPNIVFIGKTDHADLEGWYNSADFIVSGSHYEGSGIAVCEAMSCGCIPILTNIDAFRKMTGNGRCGLLYEAGNAEQLLEALLQSKVMDLGKEREKTLAQFRTELSFGAIAADIDHLLNRLGHAG